MLGVLSGSGAYAQSAVIHYGKIFFEQKVNTHKRMMRDEEESEWFERMKDKIPKYKITNYEFIFNMQESLYFKSKTQPEANPNTPLWLKNDEEVSTIYKNTALNQITHQKTLLDKLFLVQDSMMHYKWTMSNEFRIIAGYNCRRATTILMDSVYVIAFYTDAIVPSNGPLSLTGLPGTILGVVIPRLNKTIFATKVDIASAEVRKFDIPSKGTKINYQKATELLQTKSSNSWMKKYVAEYIWDLRL
jgi:GLPGLI family protein